MSVSKMRKLTVIIPAQDADAVLKQLMKLKAVALRREEGDPPPAAPDGQIAEAEKRLARIEEAMGALNRYSNRKRRLFAGQIPVSPDAFSTDGRYDTAWKVVDETRKILKNKADGIAERERQSSLRTACRPYLSLPFPLNYNGTDTTLLAVGCFPGGTRESRVRERLGDLPVSVFPLSEEASGLYTAVLYHKREQDAVLQALSAMDFMRAPLPTVPQTARELLTDAEQRLEELEKEAARLEARLASLAEKLSEVEVLWDIEKSRLLVAQNKQALASTAKCAVLRGWIPAGEEARIVATLSPLCTAYELEDPAPGDEPPVLLKNRGFAKSFEWVLGMYAYPRYGTYDPTLIMSVFYFLIFGLMFADAGYGALLCAACFSLVRWAQPRESMKRFLLMFGYCGISCTLFGILFGSYFGNFPLAFMENVLKLPPDRMPNLSLLPSEAANVAVLLDPLQDPMGFLLISLGMGALHLLAGMAVKAFLLCRHGRVIDALCDILLYWVLFAGIGVLFFYRRVGVILLCVGVGGILLTHGRKKKGFVGKAVGGFLGLYELVSFASDLLSYCRILALGLATAVIAQVVNIMATLKGASFIGFLLMILVFTVGHGLNLVINILGTFVHTARLQYIEFFNKFYEEGGLPFRPISNADKYTRDVSGEGDATPRPPVS